MKQLSILILLVIGSLSLRAQLSFKGNSLPVISIQPEASTGLEMIYVLDKSSGVTTSYAGADGGNAQWFRFSSAGGASADVIARGQEIKLHEGSYGYIVNVDGRNHCYWIVDYSQFPYTISDISVSTSATSCDRLFLDVTGSAPAINYYTISGAPKVLSRAIYISYTTLEWNDDSKLYSPIETSVTIDNINSSFNIPAPLCNTTVSIDGDRFQREWGISDPLSSTLYVTPTVEAHTWGTVVEHAADNEIGNHGSGDFTGSAPLDITFSGVVSDAVSWMEWQISHDPEFAVIDLRYNQEEFNYTFNDYGTYYVRFQIANYDASCDWTSDTYTVNVGESQLLCPNAFSPGNADGLNDYWKVSYKSIIRYECHIFNRWGKQLFSSHNPADGWDGKQGGKTVPDGVYFYVIKALGADGHRYNLSGDINVITSKSRPVYSE